jgi:hypothetical protein
VLKGIISRENCTDAEAVSLLTNSIKPSPNWEASSRSATQNFFLYFMGTECSLPCPQELALYLSPASDDSIPYPQNIMLSSILILFCHTRLGLFSGLLSSGFPTDILYAFLSSSPHSFYIPCQSYSPWCDHYNYRYMPNGAIFDALYNAIFSKVPLFDPPPVHIF